MIAAFSITPLGVGEGVGEYVAAAVRVVRDSGLPNHTDAMFTTVEGDWADVMDVVKRAVDAVAVAGPPGQPGPQGRHPARRDRPGWPARWRPSSATSRTGPAARERPGRGRRDQTAAAGICSISAARPASSSRSAGRTVRSCRT